MALRRASRTRSKAKATFAVRAGKKARPPIVVVGFGRLGGAIALGLQRARWPVTVFPRSGESVRRTVAFGLRLADEESLSRAAAVLLAVPDSAVAQLAESIKADLGPHTAIIHCAGALDLSVFGTDAASLRRPRGSFHPLVAVSDPTDSLAEHAVALSASSRELMQLLTRMAADLKLEAIEVSEARRTAYHAGAVMSAGGLVSLASAAIDAFGEAGIEPEAAARALLPLMRSALRGVQARGLQRGLTGPVARGDLDVVRAHMDALPTELAEVYRLLSLRALKVAGSRLPPETRVAMEKLLKR